MTDGHFFSSSTAQRPGANSTTPTHRSRRWPWVIGLAATLAIGWTSGAIIGSNLRLADDNPTVQARLQQLSVHRGELEQRTASREQELDEREDELNELQDRLDTRKASLDKRKRSLDERDSALDARQSAIKAEETEIAENTVPGDGVFVVGDDIKAGTYKTAGPSSSGIDTCYWAFKTGTGSDADIVDNNLVQGQATVTLRAGQIFETQSCQDWKRQ